MVLTNLSQASEANGNNFKETEDVKLTVLAKTLFRDPMTSAGLYYLQI